MHITLTPQFRDDLLTLNRAGDVLTVNGVDYDFGLLLDGATLPRNAVECDWLASDIARIGGVLHMTLILPWGANAPEATRFPAPITLTEDGPVTLPIHDIVPDMEPEPIFINKDEYME